MAFKINDLMISDLSEPSGCKRNTHCGPCSDATCGACTYVTIGHLENGSATSSEDLTALKEQLKQRLAEVEKQHADAEQSVLPQTVEQVAGLSQKLNAALAALKERRAELSKKAGPSG